MQCRVENLICQSMADRLDFFEVAPEEVIEIKDAPPLPPNFGQFLQQAVSRAQRMLCANFQTMCKACESSGRLMQKHRKKPRSQKSRKNKDC